jgi:predicted DNA-binding transcriptional regulator AlpA
MGKEESENWNVNRRFLSVEEAAKKFHVSLQMIYTAIEEEQLPAYIVEGAAIVSERAVTAWRLSHFSADLDDVFDPDKMRFIPDIFSRLIMEGTLPGELPNTEYEEVLTFQVATLLDGIGDAIEDWLAHAVTEPHHQVPGKISHLIVRDEENPRQILLIYIWDRWAMPSIEERKAALIGVFSEYSDMLTWDDQQYFDGSMYNFIEF